MALRWGRKPSAPQSRLDGERPVGQYVRSRTISAYAPAPASGMARTSIHELHAFRRLLIRALVAAVTGIVLCAVAVWQLTATIDASSYSPAVTSVPDQAPIRAAVDDYYATRPLERLRFLTDRTSLGAYVAAKVPEVKDVADISGAGIGTSHLSLTMRVPVASWHIGNKTVYVDSDGVAFDHDYYGTGIVTVDDQSGIATGSANVASGSMIRYIGQIIALLKSNGTGTVTRVVLPAGTLRELDVYLEGRGYRVKTQLDRDVASQAADIKAALTYIDAHGGAGEYVDARVEGKAYYK